MFTLIATLIGSGTLQKMSLLYVGGIISCCGVLDCTKRIKFTNLISICFLGVEALWSAASCYHAFSNVTQCSQTLSQSKPLLPQVASVRVFYRSNGKYLRHHDMIISLKKEIFTVAFYSFLS